MPTKTIVCPSGLTGEIRNLKAKEMSILADPANRQMARGKGKGDRSNPLDAIYANVWLSTQDAGPYKLDEKGQLNWSKVLLADRFFILLQVRDLTWGAYEFKVKCKNTDCPRHKKPFLWDLDLSALQTKSLPDASFKKVAAGDFVFDLEVAGKKCKFRLMTGRDEVNAPTLADDVPTSKKLLAVMATRLFEVEGIEDDEDRVDWVGELDIPDLLEANKAMEAVDGGVETRTKVECPECEEVFTIDVPFGSPDFLAPTPT